ncbi:glutaredoxin family protein [Bacillus sp. T33-2]|uniref:glutaredoxin family protein n=1 Tax=Bacillus sp. T33-2 TaxID=2054168 RepID=UPI000C777B5C|nr:glutaredoxin family protein [Bacillus sp. T33-2]PLR99494.1 glutaredoxin [Bacillus sp. T33-2]
MVTIYTKTICPKCIAAKAFFEGNDVQFDIVNIEHDDQAKQKLVDLGFMSVPVVEHENNFYTNMGEFEDLLINLK